MLGHEVGVLISDRAEGRITQIAFGKVRASQGETRGETRQTGTGNNRLRETHRAPQRGEESRGKPWGKELHHRRKAQEKWKEECRDGEST